VNDPSDEFFFALLFGYESSLVFKFYKGITTDFI